MLVLTWEKVMKAVGYQLSLPPTQKNALLDIELPAPVAIGYDLLVEVKAVAVNPVDAKVRASTQPVNGEWKVLGWDAAGVVRAVGPSVTMFKPGDEVWYAGTIARAGSNSELHLVDEKIVGLKPKTLDYAAAVALPLTSLTAWEMLFDRLCIPKGSLPTEQSILVIGAAGGVGSIMVQLARKLTGLTIIATASRIESQSWVRQLGAHHVINHEEALAPQLKAIGIPSPNYVVSLTHTDQYFDQIVEVIAPQGKFGLIDDPKSLLDMTKLKRKSISLHWEFMFTRSLFNTEDVCVQHKILTEVAALVDRGIIQTTASEHFGQINAENLRRAHVLLESGQSRGKLVLAGF